MTDFPEPLTPPECDLRGMTYMPLDVVRLLDSDLFALSTGDEFKAAVALWAKAFLQVPAGSLPDDDRILAHLSSTGRQWAEVRDMALRGWVRCSDGRLYHPVVAEKANEAWRARIAHRQRTEAARAAKAAKKASSASNNAPPTSAAMSVTDSVATSVTETVTGSKGEGEGEGELKRKEEEPVLRTGRAERVAGPAEPPPDIKTTLFREGLDRLRRLTGHDRNKGAALLGRLLKAGGNDHAMVSLVLAEAEDMRPADPVPWLMRAVETRAGGHRSFGRPDQQSAPPKFKNPFLARQYAEMQRQQDQDDDNPHHPLRLI